MANYLELFSGKLHAPIGKLVHSEVMSQGASAAVLGKGIEEGCTTLEAQVGRGEGMRGVTLAMREVGFKP